MSISYIEYRKLPWIVTWKNSWTGKKHTKAFAEESEAQAFEQVQKDIAAQEKAVLRKARRVRPAQSRILVTELLESYFRLAHTNPVTIRQAGYHASHITRAFGGRMAALLTRQDILNFTEAQKLKSLAQSTINRRVSILRAALNWAVRNGLLGSNPLADLRMPRSRSRRIAPPSPQEAKAILAAAAPHVQRVVILGFYVGARIGASELFRLEWSAVDIDNAMIRMPSAHKSDTQDGRDVPIKKALLPILRTWLVNDLQHGHAHVIHWGGQPVRSIARAWHTALRRAGIARRIRPYDLRHAYATYSLAGGADIGSVAKIMGHTDASMILKTYQHVQDTQKRAAVETLPDILPATRSHRRPGLPD